MGRGPAARVCETAELVLVEVWLSEDVFFWALHEEHAASRSSSQVMLEGRYD